MLPLISHIGGEILDLHRRLGGLAREQGRLDRQRRTLDWPARSRRYQVRDELVEVEERLKAARLELERLGIVLLDPATGRVGLPTAVSGHRAFFSWMPGDEGLRFWHFAGEMTRRSIPANWKETGEAKLTGIKP
jgi:hypothetical protein